MGKWETCFWFSTFPSGAKLGCGNVGIAGSLRDFQGAVVSVGKLPLLFHAFHGPVISTALFLSPPHGQFGPFGKLKLYWRFPLALWPYVFGGMGDSILHRRKSFTFAAAIFRAHSVSLIFCAVCSNCTKLMLGFKYCCASGNPFSFSYGVA